MGLFVSGPAAADNPWQRGADAPENQPKKEEASWQRDSPPAERRKYSELEKQIAREIIATGRLLQGDPRFDEVVQHLARKSGGYIPLDGPRLGIWVENQIRDMVPDLTANRMAGAAIIAAGREIAGTAGGVTRHVTRPFITSPENVLSPGRTLDVNARGVDDSILEGLIRGVLEGGKAAAKASNVHALNHIELDYTLSEGGVREYSVLSVQPLYESPGKQHNLFAQASYANKDVDRKRGSGQDRRHTLNSGLAYRYVTEDEQQMFGANVFFDHQWPYHHNRLSIGLDYKTVLLGFHANRYFGVSDWRDRGDGFEEKAMSGYDMELSGRFARFPQLELFARGFQWERDRTPVLNTDGDDIWGYEFSAEYTPYNFITFRTSVTDDTDLDNPEIAATLRLNYTFGQNIERPFAPNNVRLDSVLDRRFEKVRRQNEIRVQVRQAEGITGVVTFAQGANVSTGQTISFGQTITTGASPSSATIEFGDGGTLDIAANTEVIIGKDLITLVTGMVQYVSGSTNVILNTPGETVELIGTDVDLRVAGPTTTLRVRDGQAVLTDDTGSLTVNETEVARSISGDGVIPQLITSGNADFDAHVTTALNDLTLQGPSIVSDKTAPVVSSPVNVSGSLLVGQTLTFTVPLTKTVSVSGSPTLEIQVGGFTRQASLTGGAGTNILTFEYVLQDDDGGQSNVTATRIVIPGGDSVEADGGRPVVPEVTGDLAGSVPFPGPPLDERGNVSSSNMNQAQAVAVSGNFAYVAGDAANSLTVVDISDPDNPVERGSVSGGALNDARDVAVSGNFAYVATENNDSLTVVDVSDPDNPVIRGVESSSNMNAAFGVDVSGNFAYVAADLAGSMTIVDISDPDNPFERGNVDTSNLNGARGVVVSGSFAYVSADDADALTVIDISDPDNPVERGSVSGSDLNGAQYVAVSGNFAYVTAADADAMTVVDVSDPDNPVIRGSYSSASNLTGAQGVDVSGNIVYVAADGSDALTAIDVSDPDNPVLEFTITSSNLNGASDVTVTGLVPGNYAYVATDSADGLTVVDINLP